MEDKFPTLRKKISRSNNSNDAKMYEQTAEFSFFLVGLDWSEHWKKTQDENFLSSHVSTTTFPPFSVFHVGITTYDDDNVAFTKTTLLASLRMACSNNSGDITRQNEIIEGNFGWEGERDSEKGKKKKWAKTTTTMMWIHEWEWMNDSNIMCSSRVMRRLPRQQKRLFAATMEKLRVLRAPPEHTTQGVHY